jgi:predicted Ser/Thr protein kinase
MKHARNGISESELRDWIRSGACETSPKLGSGYQGSVYLFTRGDERLVVKTARGRGLAGALQRLMLRSEFRVYERLGGLAGVPECHGMIDGKYLVLEYVAGLPFRGATLEDRERFFERLLELIRALHARGVAHGDLKKKDNLLVIDGRDPCIVDFGVAVARRRRFAPLNRYWFRLARTFDYNAWAKLKSSGDLSRLSAEELRLVRRTRVERVASALKSTWLRLRRSLGA